MGILQRLQRAISSKELKKAERDMEYLRYRIEELGTWCGYDSPEIGHAANYLLDPYNHPMSNGPYGAISAFRESLRSGLLTFDDLKQRA